MQVNFQKVVLITGAARRIGAAIAKYLHASGCRIVIHYRHSVNEATKLQTELNALRPDSAILLQGDLLQISQFDSFIAKIIQKWGRLDALVNNASEFQRTDLSSIDEKKWHTLMDTNLKAPFFLSQAASPFLQETKGCIVNITDIHGERPMKEYAVYCISKSGLIMLTKALAKEYGARIRVNAVSPAGGVMWPEEDNALDENKKQAIIAQTALKRAGKPDDIAKAVGYFIFDANYVTGQVLAIDGGRSLKI